MTGAPLAKTRNDFRPPQPNKARHLRSAHNLPFAGGSQSGLPHLVPPTSSQSISATSRPDRRGPAIKHMAARGGEIGDAPSSDNPAVLAIRGVGGSLRRVLRAAALPYHKSHVLSFEIKTGVIRGQATQKLWGGRKKKSKLEKITFWRPCSSRAAATLGVLALLKIHLEAPLWTEWGQLSSGALGRSST